MKINDILNEGMPSVVAKQKQKLAAMSNEELRKRFEELAADPRFRGKSALDIAKEQERRHAVRPGTYSSWAVNEVAPPGQEEWIKKRKPEFKARYGKDWERVLYSTAWNRENKKNESLQEEGDKEGRESPTLKALHQRSRERDAEYKAKGFAGIGDGGDAATFGPTEEYPLPWRVAGRPSEPNTIYSANNKTVATWLRSEDAHTIIGEVTGELEEDTAMENPDLAGIIKDLKKVSEMWGQAGDHDEAEYQYEEVAIFADRLADEIENLSFYIDQAPVMRKHPMVERIYSMALKSGVISKEEVPRDVQLQEDDQKDSAGGRYATMQTKPEGYLKGQRFVG
jgi:hypothetical protein